MENLKYCFDELIVAKLIYSIYCLGVFTTVSPSRNSVRLMMSKNRTACMKVRTSRGLIQQKQEVKFISRELLEPPRLCFFCNCLQALLNIFGKQLHTNGVYTAFPNTEVIFGIYLSLISTNCSGERSFGQLARIKNVKRSTMSQDRLGVLALLCIERELLHEIDFSSVIDEFAAIKSRKVAISFIRH